jgi:hypothetical protein
MPKSYPGVKKVKPMDDYQLILTFSNRVINVFDMKPYLDKGIFRELRDVPMFNTVHISFDTIEWDNNADFDPEVLFKLGKKIKKSSSSFKRQTVISESAAKYSKG